jgi:hypothetical protein
MNHVGAGSLRVPIVFTNTDIHPVVDELETLRLVVGDHFEPSAQARVVLYTALGY